jgi:hypothetical protein
VQIVFFGTLVLLGFIAYISQTFHFVLLQSIFAWLAILIVEAIFVYHLSTSLYSGEARLNFGRIPLGSTAISRKDQPLGYWFVMAIDLVAIMIWSLIIFLEGSRFFSTGHFIPF